MLINSNVVSSSAQLSNGGGVAFSGTNNVTFNEVTASIVNGLGLWRGSNTSYNIGIGWPGWYTLNNLTTGQKNVAIGLQALEQVTEGSSNIAIGASALRDTKTGGGNIALSTQALAKNREGSENVAIGGNALGENQVGGYNFALGAGTLGDNISGSHNIGIGYNTARGITTGNYNTVIGGQVTGLSAGLANTVILADGQGQIRLYTDSNGNTGLGKTNPQAKLDVNGTTMLSGSLFVSGSVHVGDGTSVLPSYTFANDTGSGLFLNSAGSLGFATGNTRVAYWGINGLNFLAGIRVYSNDNRFIDDNGNLNFFNSAATLQGGNINHATVGGIPSSFSVGATAGAVLKLKQDGIDRLVLSGSAVNITGSVQVTGSINLTGSLSVLGSIAYTPASSSHWNSPAPTTIAEAIDRIAAALFASGSLA